MENQFQLTIDGNEVKFAIKDAPPALVDPERPGIDPSRPILVVTTKRDGKMVWSGLGSYEVADDIPVTEQFTPEQLTEIYQRARRRRYETQVSPPSA